MNEPRVSDERLSDLRHTNRHDSQVIPYLLRDGSQATVSVNALTDDLIDCRSRCSALAAEVERMSVKLDEVTLAGRDAVAYTMKFEERLRHLKDDRRALVEAAVRAGFDCGRLEWSTGMGERIAARVLKELDERG